MGRSFIRLAIAVSLALCINGGLAVAMAYWSNFEAVPRRPKQVKEPVEIPFVKPPPPKKKTETPRRSSAKAQVAKANLPALNLPSSIAIPVFSTETAQPPRVVHPKETATVSALGENTVLTEDMVDEPPRPVASAPLRYPKSAETDGIEGEVETRLLLSADGKVLQVNILSATPPGVFEQPAKESLLQWRFAPATFRGQKLKAWVRQRVVFKLH
ncbi:MAG: TonB family protein [Deltaproteobacteria bacterium]|nr:TonB family protein [Deltaproteobacteria bacterium]